jgi:NAD(P)-dependent dehydrogenase (short-subunit alcohol dehydrogenase family)
MLTNRVAVVTGAASGIGRSTALLYAREGASVVVADIDSDGGQETIEMIGASGGQGVFVKADVADPAACEALVKSAIMEFGRLDFACNNAGIAGEQNPTAEYSIEGWQRLIAINLSGVFYCMKYELQAMLQSGGGSIINIASILGHVGFAGAPAYVSAKHGVIGLTVNAALEYGQHGIRVNAVGPGFIRTPMISVLEQDPAIMQQIVAMHPIGRLGEAEEVAELVVWLSSDKASFITGGYYPIDGGYLAR